MVSSQNARKGLSRLHVLAEHRMPAVPVKSAQVLKPEQESAIGALRFLAF